MALRLTACLIALLLSACASSGGPKSSTQGSDRNLITGDEVTQSHQTDAYATIRALRPNMLAVQGPNAVSGDDPGIVVFLNGQRFGDVNSLRQISANEIAEIRFLSPGQAQYTYGTGYPEGVIQVKTRTN